MEIITTVIVGLTVGVIILIIEYRYFQRKRQAKDEMLVTSTEQRLLTNDSSQEPDEERQALIEQTVSNPLPWPEAINLAVKSFSGLHPNCQVEIHKTNIRDSIAYLEIYVWNRDLNLTAYNLRVRKDGEIIDINQY
jgi:hypothetical protein